MFTIPLLFLSKSFSKASRKALFFTFKAFVLASFNCLSILESDIISISFLTKIEKNNIY